MLQQILKDMYIDPDVLEALNEDQKKTLFLKMRQEQVRRWNEREESGEGRRPKPKTANSKSVSWLLGRDGDVSVMVIGEVDEQKPSKLICSGPVDRTSPLMGHNNASQQITPVKGNLVDRAASEPCTTGRENLPTKTQPWIHLNVKQENDEELRILPPLEQLELKQELEVEAQEETPVLLSYRPHPKVGPSQLSLVPKTVPSPSVSCSSPSPVSSYSPPPISSSTPPPVSSSSPPPVSSYSPTPFSSSKNLIRDVLEKSSAKAPKKAMTTTLVDPPSSGPTTTMTTPVDPPSSGPTTTSMTTVDPPSSGPTTTSMTTVDPPSSGPKTMTMAPVVPPSSGSKTMTPVVPPSSGPKTMTMTPVVPPSSGPKTMMMAPVDPSSSGPKTMMTSTVDPPSSGPETMTMTPVDPSSSGPKTMTTFNVDPPSSGPKTMTTTPVVPPSSGPKTMTTTPVVPPSSGPKTMTTTPVVPPSSGPKTMTTTPVVPPSSGPKTMTTSTVDPPSSGPKTMTTTTVVPPSSGPKTMKTSTVDPPSFGPKTMTTTPVVPPSSGPKTGNPITLPSTIALSPTPRTTSPILSRIQTSPPLIAAPSLTPSFSRSPVPSIYTPAPFHKAFGASSIARSAAIRDSLRSATKTRSPEKTNVMPLPVTSRLHPQEPEVPPQETSSSRDIRVIAASRRAMSEDGFPDMGGGDTMTGRGRVAELMKTFSVKNPPPPSQSPPPRGNKPSIPSKPSHLRQTASPSLR